MGAHGLSATFTVDAGCGVFAVSVFVLLEDDPSDDVFNDLRAAPAPNIVPQLGAAQRNQAARTLAPLARRPG